MSKVVINPNSSINNPRIDFSNNVTSSFIDVSNNNFEFGTFTGNIRLLTNNKNPLTVINNGNVGIATTNPLYTLDVSGTGNFTGNIVCPRFFVGNLITAGVNWSVATFQNTGLQSFCVCYGNGLFVAIFRLYYLRYSTDGINWNLTSSGAGAGNEGYSVCYGNGRFVMVGINMVYISTDAITWTLCPIFTGMNQRWYSVCYGNNMYVAVSGENFGAYSSNAIYSYDGFIWTLSPNTDISNNWYSVCYGYSNGSGRFVAVNNGSSTNNMMHSTNGVNWTPVVRSPKTNFDLNSCCYGNGYFVAIGKDVTSGTNHNIWISNDISNNVWRLISNTYVYTNYATGTVCYGNGYFVIVFGNTVIYSNDVSNNVWKSSVTSGFSSGTDFQKSICYGNGKFVVVKVLTGDNNTASSGYPTTTTNPGTNMTNDILYINKNITLYDNTSTTNKGNTGLQYKSTSVPHIWSLVQNNSTNNLSFSSLYGYQFYTNSTSVSLGGTRSMIISTGGNVRIGTKTSLDVSSNLEVFGTTLINGNAILKTLAGNTISLNVGDETTDPALYGLFQIKNRVEVNLTKSTFSFINYTNNEYWQLGDIQTSHIGFFGSAGRYSSYFAISTVPCMTIHTSNFLGINKTIPTVHLDVSGNARYSGRTNMDGNLTCSSISVVNNNSFGNNIWFITYGVGDGVTATTPAGGNIGATSNGFGNVYLNGNATPTTTGMATYWNTTLATFTAPQNGLYRFQLQVYDSSSNVTTRGNCLQIRGNGLQFQDNGGQYLMFGQAYNASGGQYIITQTLYLLTGQIIYYANTSPSVGLTWFFGKGHTNLTITQLC